MSIYSIYKATNIFNGKIYIGFDSHWPKRKREHLYASRHGSTLYFHNALPKYGSDSFTWEVICQSKDGQHLLNEMEPYFIKEFNSFHMNGHGYNMTLGGEGGLGHIMSEDTKNKMSELAKLRPRQLHTEETKIKIGLSHKGRKKSEEHRQKLKRPKSVEHRRKLSDANKGKSIPDVVKEKISVSLSGSNNPMYGKLGEQHPAYGHRHTEETKRRISEKKKGKKHSELTKQRISEGRMNKGTGQTNAMANLENRKKVSLSKIGKRKYTRPDGSYYMAYPQKEEVLG